jgi:hypothetical protein
LLAGCGGGATDNGTGPRVAIVVLENHGPAAVLRGWLADQARGGARASNAFGGVHPSLGNYLALISGSTQGVEDDDVDRPLFRAPTIAGQLTRAGVPWKAYMNAMPRPCFGREARVDQTGRYAKRHNPFLLFSDVAGDAKLCRSHVVPGDRLSRDIAEGALPRFIWITPDLCQDMHDCSVQTGLRWMARALPPLLEALGPDGVLFVTADEGTDDQRGGGRIPLIALGDGARPGAVVRDAVGHPDLLATIEDRLGLPRLETTRHAASLAAMLWD